MAARTAVLQEMNAMTIRRSTPVVFAALLIGLAFAPRAAFAQKLSDAEFKKLSLSATATAADHKKLAAHYRAHAAEHEADAKVHEEIVAAAKKAPASGHSLELALGAAHYAEHSREAAEALIELATLHEGMAEAAAKPAH
jgi:hypothetical protein